MQLTTVGIKRAGLGEKPARRLGDFGCLGQFVHLLLERLLHRGWVEHHRDRVGRQRISHPLSVRAGGWQHELVAGKGARSLHRVVKQAPFARRQQQLLGPLGHGRPGLGRRHLLQRKRSHREHGELFGLVERTLVGGIKKPHRLYFVSEQFEPAGVSAAGRPEVDYATAHRVLAGFFNAARPAIAKPVKRGPCLLELELIARQKVQGRVAQRRERSQAQGQCFDRSHNDRSLHCRQLVQRRRARGHDLGGRRHHFERRRLGCREQVHPALEESSLSGLADQHRQVGHHALGRGGRSGYDKRGPFDLFEQAGRYPGGRPATQPLYAPAKFGVVAKFFSEPFAQLRGGRRR